MLTRHDKAVPCKHGTRPNLRVSGGRTDWSPWLVIRYCTAWSSGTRNCTAWSSGTRSRTAFCVWACFPVTMRPGRVSMAPGKGKTG